MAFVFVLVLLGGMLGGMVAGFPAALIGAVVAPFLWMALRKEKPKSQQQDRPIAASDLEPAVAGLAGRVQALEKELAELRMQVQRLSQDAAAVTNPELAPSELAPASVAEDAGVAEPSILDVPLAAPSVPADLSSLTDEALAPPTPDPIATAILAPEPAKIEMQEAEVPLDVVAKKLNTAGATTATAPSSTWSTPSPRQVKPPTPPSMPMRDRMPGFPSRWIFGGNTIVKVGVFILFLGLAFLLRYAAERVTVPVELRYAAVALVGAFLLGLGWRLRSRADASGGQGYGLILQGAGIGVFYLTALAAIKLHPMLTPTVAFGFMAIVSVLGAVLAVSQNAPWLALVSVAEGFAAPVLVSTGGGNHIALFSYLAVLDVGIFVMAWFRAWRPLNLVGAVSTFTLATAWAHEHYDESLYASVQFFLLLFFTLFTFIGVLFARRVLAQGDNPDPREPLATRAAQALSLVGRVDSTLTFGVPLAAYGLQYVLLRDTEWGPAWSAFGFALFYLLLGGALLRTSNRRYSLLGEAYVIVSVIFGTLTIPLALEGVWTGATWAVEAAGMYWLGARQKRVYARVFALAVLSGGVVGLVTDMGIDLQQGTPLITGSVLGMGMLGASALAMDLVHRRIPSNERSAFEAGNRLLLPTLVVAAFTAIAWMLLVPMWAGVVTAWLAFACVVLHVRHGASALQGCAAGLYTIALASLALSLHRVEGAAMLANGVPGLVAAVLIGTSLLLSAWLGLRSHLEAVDARNAAPTWSRASSLGLFAGVGVVSMSLLFAMPADKAALVWPWMGLGALWLGLRVAHPALGMCWFVMQLIAGMASIRYGSVLWWLDRETPHDAMSIWGPLALCFVGFVSGDFLQRAARTGHRSSPWTRHRLVHWGVVAWGLGWWADLMAPELHRQLQLHHEVGLWSSVLVALVLFSSMLMVTVARWRQWLVLGQATVITLPLWIFVAFFGPVGNGVRPSADMGWLVWPLALGWHLVLLRLQKSWWLDQGLKPLHVGGFWFFLLLAARECQLFMSVLGAPGSAWATLGFMLVPALVLTFLSRPSALRRWPLSEYRETYLVWASAPVGLYLWLWLWAGNTQSGGASPLPYVPILNPLEMGQGLVLLSLALWLAALADKLRDTIPRRPIFTLGGATAFALYTGSILRACHHWAGVPWKLGELFASTLTQAALSVAWSVVGVCVMLLGHRRVNRVVWAVGTCLLGVVVAKLFLVELADRGSLYRIVSFIVVGILLLVVGYFAPIPPNEKDAAKAPMA